MVTQCRFSGGFQAVHGWFVLTSGLYTVSVHDQTLRTMQVCFYFDLRLGKKATGDGPYRHAK
ncbi:hypothetical protein DB34_04305 [Acetobacter pasteurianus]|nr:hypothetical protein DB34_04305 [Acetobacter pasteurianus]